MLVKFKFLDKEKWSLYATINTFIPLILTILAKQELDLKNMIVSSVICMMEGELLQKILFTGFINFMLMKENKKWIIKSIIYVLSVIIIHQIQFDNKLHQLSYENQFIKYILIILIILWMIRIFGLIFKKTKKIFKI